MVVAQFFLSSIVETYKDFFEEVKSRVNNPLIVSFVTTWLICNWQIPVGLIFYEQAELAGDRYTSYFDLIYKHTDIWLNLIIPLALACGYTYGFPYVKGWIQRHQAGVMTTTENKILEITKAATLKNLEVENQRLKEANKKLHIEMDEMDQANNSRALNGNWVIKIGGIEERWNITNDTVHINSKTAYRILEYISYPKNKKIAFICEGTTNPTKGMYKYFFLRSSKSNTVLKGTVNGASEVEFILDNDS